MNNINIKKVIQIPDEVLFIIATLEENGHEAYAVGGCVRDAILDIEPKDWDICTSALPEQMIECFEGQRLIETGLQHGTIALLIDDKPFEITTYRIDEISGNNKYLRESELINSLKEDLSRRDFTINAMAYNHKVGIVDFFGGVSDINDQIIRCVGNPDERFQEDPLRILRALRFASTLNFNIEAKTSSAIYRNKELLQNIAVERISVELNKLLVGPKVGNILLHFPSVISEIISEITELIGFEQKNPYHYLNVWQHTIMSITKAPADVVLRLTMLFHDIAKPRCYVEIDGIGHFYGHSKMSMDMAKEILLRLKYDNDTIEAVTQLILYHDADIHPCRKNIKGWLNRIGEERLRQLVEVKKADTMAQSKRYRLGKLTLLDNILSIMDEIIEQQQCFSLKDLAVNGRDLIAIGILEGAEVGKVLNHLMDMVVDESVENDKVKLLQIVHKEFVLK